MYFLKIFVLKATVGGLPVLAINENGIHNFPGIILGVLFIQSNRNGVP